MNGNLHAQLSRFFALGALGFAFLVLLAPSAHANPAPPRVHPAAINPAAASGLVQFTSQGHVLGFRVGEFYVSNATYALRVEFVDAKPVAPTSDTASESQSEERGAPALGRVTYANLWDGITLAYDGTRGGVVSSSFRLEAGTDPAAIRLRYNAPVTVNSDGTLTIAYATGEMMESAPRAWQEEAGERVPVSAEFALAGEREIGFRLGGYDLGEPLFIDPTLTWNTFLGGSGWDEALGIVVDANGNAFVVGYSNATWGSPVRSFAGGSDGFVAKLSASGVLIWNTFFGGSGSDGGDAIAVDSSGNIYVAGASNGSWGSPLLPFMGDSDALVAKLSPTGELTWNTFLGRYGPDRGAAVAVDGNGNVYVAGISDGFWGSPVRTFGGANEAFAAKLNSSGTLTWNTFLGGSGYDHGYGIAVDGSGNVYVAGASDVSWGSPVRAYTGGYDAFAAKLSPTGLLTWNTFFGGTSADWGRDIAVDSRGNVYVAGSSDVSWGSPVRGYTSSRDAFVAKMVGSDGHLFDGYLPFIIK